MPNGMEMEKKVGRRQKNMVTNTETEKKIWEKTAKYSH
jgi:hypothetical protein